MKSALGGERLRPHDRLRRGSDFRRVYDEGKRVVSPFFVAFARVNGQGKLRVGFVASRRVGGAVARNRSKRLLREAFRRHRAAAGASPALDLVLVARAPLARASYEELDAAYVRFVGRLVEKVERDHRMGGPESARPPSARGD